MGYFLPLALPPIVSLGNKPGPAPPEGTSIRGPLRLISHLQVCPKDSEVGVPKLGSMGLLQGSCSHGAPRGS